MSDFVLPTPTSPVRPRAASRYAGDVRTRRGELIQQSAQWLAVLMAFLVPIVVVPVGPRLGISDPLLPAVAIVLLLSRVRGRLEACHWLLMAVMAIAFVSLFQINDSRYQVLAGLKWVRLVGIALPFFLGARMVVEPRLLRRVAWSLFFGGIVAILISLAVWWLQIPIRDSQQEMYYRGGGSEFRAGGLVGETTHFGHLTATWMTVVASCLILVAPVRRWKLVAAILLGLGGLAIFAASSRSAIVNLAAMAAGYFVLQYYRPRHLSNALVTILAGFLFLVLSLVGLKIADQSGVLPSTSKLSKQVDRFLPTESNSINRFSSGRIDSWKRYMRIGDRHLLLGCGYKNSPSLIPGRVPDNSVLSTYLETGIIGLFAVTAFTLTLIFALVRQGRLGNPYATLFAAVWCGQAAQALLGDTYTLWLSMPVLYLTTGMVLQLPLDSSDQVVATEIPAGLDPFDEDEDGAAVAGASS